MTLIQCGDYAFSIDLQMLIDILLLLSIIIVFLHFVWHNVPYSGRFYLLGWPQPLGFLQPSPNLFCSFAVARVSILLSVWMTFWSWFTLSGQLRVHICFCVPCWFALIYILIFPSLTFASLRPFASWGYVRILSTWQYLCLLIS